MALTVGLVVLAIALMAWGRSSTSMTHAFIVGPHDTPSSLALWYTGDPYRYRELEEDNDNLGAHIPVPPFGTYQNWHEGLVLFLPRSWKAGEKGEPPDPWDI